MIEQKIRVRPLLQTSPVQSDPVYNPLPQIAVNPNYASQYGTVSGLDPLAMLQQYRQTGQIPQSAQTGMMAPPVFVNPAEMSSLLTSPAIASAPSNNGSNK